MSEYNTILQDNNMLTTAKSVFAVRNPKSNKIYYVPVDIWNKFLDWHLAVLKKEDIRILYKITAKPIVAKKAVAKFRKKVKARQVKR